MPGTAYMNMTEQKKWPLLHRLGVYVFAVMSAYVVATIASTQSVVSNLTAMGIDVNTGTRLSMTLDDLTGMAGAFLPMIAAGYLVAFLVVGLLCRWWPQSRKVLYVLAGAAALITIHMLLKYALGITPVAAARTTSGLIVQGLAGAVGGYVFARFSLAKK